MKQTRIHEINKILFSEKRPEVGIIKARAFVKINTVYNLKAKELNSTESRQYIDLALGSHHQLSHDMQKKCLPNIQNSADSNRSVKLCSQTKAFELCFTIHHSRYTMSIKLHRCPDRF